MSRNALSERSWSRLYNSKVVSAAEAISHVSSGQSIYVHSNAAAPQALLRALVDRSDTLRNVQIYHLLTLGEAKYAQPAYAGSFRAHALFIGPNVRDAVNDGRADYTPVFLSEIPALFASRALPIDVCLLNISPPDEHGYCSYGVSVDCSIAARKAARLVIGQVNKHMPRTMGRSFVHVSKFDYLVEADEPIPELKLGELGDIEHAIGKNVASLVQDGATLQLGIGGIPNAVLYYLKDRKDLGLHSEMLSDGAKDLIEAGVITNDRKTVLPGKVAVSFIMGTRKLYDFVDNNPMVEFQTSDYINDPYVISQNYRMTSINSALEVDLTGQICSDSIGDKLYSGFGGQVDFVRGSSRSAEGRAIIAIPSTAKDGQLSRIVNRISGAVVTSRADVHFVVTEYGIAELYGKNLKQRAKALIDIAHPKFRAQLEKDAAAIPWLK